MANDLKFGVADGSLISSQTLSALLRAAAAGDIVALARLRLLSQDAEGFSKNTPLSTLPQLDQPTRNAAAASAVSPSVSAVATHVTQAVKPTTTAVSLTSGLTIQTTKSSTAPTSSFSAVATLLAAPTLPSVNGLSKLITRTPLSSSPGKTPPTITLQSSSAPAVSKLAPLTRRESPTSTELTGGGASSPNTAQPPPRSTEHIMSTEVGHMAYFPRAAAVTGERTARWIDRAPVYVDGQATPKIAVAGSTNIIATLTGAGSGLNLPATLFSGSGVLKSSIRGKRLTSLKARVNALYQDDYYGAGTSGNPPDLYASEHIAAILTRLVATIYADATDAYAMRPIPLRSLLDGVIFPDGTEPFCDSDDFRMEVSEPTSGLSSFTMYNATLVSAELYFEAVFE